MRSPEAVSRPVFFFYREFFHSHDERSRFVHDLSRQLRLDLDFRQRMKSRADLEAYSNTWKAVNRVIKVVVVDADGVLWDGIVGDDGLAGIRITERHKALQRKLLQIKEHGALLAINSKNGEGDLLNERTGAFAHSDMVLRPHDFVVIKANWNPKNENMEAIAKELNLDLSSFVFVDDSPQERARIQEILPCVRVIDFPDVAKLVEILEGMGFGAGQATQEDKRRTQLYEENRQRAAERSRYATEEEFYHSLGMEIRIFKGEENMGHLSRLADMTRRFNRFNLTASRYSEQELRQLIQNPQYRVFALSYRDNKQPEPTVDGLMIVKIEINEATIEAFLLSCRAI